MLKIAVDHSERAVLAHAFEEVGAHRDERRRPARRAVQPAEELLPAGLGRIVDLARRRSVADGAPARYGVLHADRVWPESVCKSSKKRGPVGVFEAAVAGKDLASQREARGFAAAGEQRAAHVGE